MRYSTVLPFAAAASAIVIPDDVTLKSLALDDAQHVDNPVSSWWHSVPSADDIRTSVGDILSTSLEALEHQAKKIHDFIPDVEIDFFDHDGHDGHGRHPHRPPHRDHPDGRDPSTYTIYEAIQASNYTKKFAKLVDDFPDIVQLLNSTKANHTLFAPIDKAFDKIPEHHKEPSKEFLEKILEYHIVPGLFPAGRVLAGHTFPTLLKEDALGGRRQRLRVHLSLFGLRVNFYSKIVAANLFFKNGVVHGVSSILVPPPPAEKIVSLLPGEFSTLLLAAEKTGLRREKDDKDHDHSTSGLTIFAPTNTAFRRLGPAANAFLFNSEKGLKYLKALLKYHIVVNETLYSDAYYGHGKEEEEFTLTTSDGGHDHYKGQFHVDLPTLLDDKSLSIDIARWYGLIEIKINGFTRVAVQDGVAKDGVIHALQTVLIPPHEQRGAYPADTEISVEDLIEYLGPHVVEGDEDAQKADWFGEL